jgi:hypothetical protein
MANSRGKNAGAGQAQGPLESWLYVGLSDLERTYAAGGAAHDTELRALGATGLLVNALGFAVGNGELTDAAIADYLRRALAASAGLPVYLAFQMAYQCQDPHDPLADGQVPHPWGADDLWARTCDNLRRVMLAASKEPRIRGVFGDVEGLGHNLGSQDPKYCWRPEGKGEHGKIKQRAGQLVQAFLAGGPHLRWGCYGSLGQEEYLVGYRPFWRQFFRAAQAAGASEQALVFAEDAYDWGPGTNVRKKLKQQQSFYSTAGLTRTVAVAPMPWLVHAAADNLAWWRSHLPVWQAAVDSPVNRLRQVLFFEQHWVWAQQHPFSDNPAYRDGVREVLAALAA